MGCRRRRIRRSALGAGDGRPRVGSVRPLSTGWKNRNREAGARSIARGLLVAAAKARKLRITGNHRRKRYGFPSFSAKADIPLDEFPNHSALTLEQLWTSR